MIGKIRQVGYAVLTALLVACSSTATTPQPTATLVTPAVASPTLPTPSGITPTSSAAATRAAETAPVSPGGVDASKPEGAGKPQSAGKPEGAGKPTGVAPQGATCPPSHPIKGNRGGQGKPDRIYHLPGSPAYAAAVIEECFATEVDAQAAGYRRSER